MDPIRVILYDAKPFEIESFDRLNQKYHFQLDYTKDRLTYSSVKQSKHADAVCLFVNDTVSADIVEQLTDNGVQLIALRCAGYNQIDLNAIYKKIPVARVPAYSPHAVAEFALTLIMTLNRKIHKAYARTRENNFTLNGLMGFDMKDKTVGVIGTGKIGKTLIKILKGLDTTVLAYDRFPDHNHAQDLCYSYVQLSELFQRSDIISLHCPLNPETYHLINEQAIATMKDQVMVINTGRGALVDTSALIQGLKSQKIGSAGLDVYEEESTYFFEDFSAEIIQDDQLTRLLTFPNVIITSHQGFLTQEAYNDISETTMENIHRFFNEQRLPNEICYQCENSICQHDLKGSCFFG